jgi:hypothetical protein
MGGTTGGTDGETATGHGGIMEFLMCRLFGRCRVHSRAYMELLEFEEELQKRHV